VKLRKAANKSDFSDLKPIFLDFEGSRVAVYRFHGKYYAYANQCPHQGGPACEGIVIGNTEAELIGGGAVKECLSSGNMNIVCPWHGVEFDLTTGVCRADPRYRLRSYETLVDSDQILIRT
jgi:nitrite reductase (NADH) small subunit